MRSTRISSMLLVRALALSFACLSVVPLCATAHQTQDTQQPASTSPSAKPVGTVKALSGNTITLTTSSGSTVDIVVQNSTRMVRIAPGQKDLKDATPVQLQEVHVGDRILARGTPSEDGKSVAASSIILMKESDVSAKQEQDREDWQKRGVGG